MIVRRVSVADAYSTNIRPAAGAVAFAMGFAAAYRKAPLPSNPLARTISINWGRLPKSYGL